MAQFIFLFILYRTASILHLLRCSFLLKITFIFVTLHVSKCYSRYLRFLRERPILPASVSTLNSTWNLLEFTKSTTLNHTR